MNNWRSYGGSIVIYCLFRVDIHSSPSRENCARSYYHESDAYLEREESTELLKMPYKLQFPPPRNALLILCLPSFYFQQKRFT